MSERPSLPHCPARAGARPCVTVMRSRRTGEYALQALAYDAEFGALAHYGAPRPVTSEEMERGGLERVLADLEQFPARDGGDPAHRAPVLTRGERQRFSNVWQLVSISLRVPRGGGGGGGGGRLEIQPLRRSGRRGGGGGHVGYPEDRIFLRLPTTQRTFLRKLEQAFDAVPGS